MKKKLVLLSDCTDVAVNEIRMSIYEGLKEDIQIEPAINIIPFSLINCSFLLRLVSEIAEPNTIFYIVVNPIKGQPPRIIGKTIEKGFVFVGRDSGVFGWLVERYGCAELYHINNNKFVPFGGKKIYPNVISQYINGIPIKDLGTLVDSNTLNKLEINEGTVLHIDNFGLVKIMYDEGVLKALDIKNGDFVNVSVNGNFAIKALYSERMMSENDGVFTVCVGSSLNGLLELGCVRGNICHKINVKVGDHIGLEKYVNVC